MNRSLSCLSIVFPVVDGLIDSQNFGRASQGIFRRCQWDRRLSVGGGSQRRLGGHGGRDRGITGHGGEGVEGPRQHGDLELGLQDSDGEDDDQSGPGRCKEGGAEL